jgi:hypothetical protein
LTSTRPFPESRVDALAPPSRHVSIGRAHRNNKEGRDWDELEPKDKIDLNGLKLLKPILPAGVKDGECHVWFDNLRLLQEDAAAQKVRVPCLPAPRHSTSALKEIATPGFEVVAAGDPRLQGKGITDVKCVWPEPLIGGGVWSAEPFAFEAPLPDGECWMWLSARKFMIGPERQFSLPAGGEKLFEETLSDIDFYDEKAFSGT